MPGKHATSFCERYTGRSLFTIVNHWPSRCHGGSVITSCASLHGITRHIADSSHADNPQAKVTVGDMNDDPDNESCSQVLGAVKSIREVKPGGYYNATWKLLSKASVRPAGNRWNLPDQQIVSAPDRKGPQYIEALEIGSL